MAQVPLGDGDFYLAYAMATMQIHRLYCNSTSQQIKESAKEGIN